MELMPKYKKTEVGVIPVEWKIYRLGDLVKSTRSIRYGIVQPGKFDVTGCYMLRSQDYSKGWAGLDGMHKVSGHLENQYRNARIGSNDLVMTVVGAGIGQVVVLPEWLDGAILSRSTARIAIDEDRAARGFVQAVLEGPVGKRQILDAQKEGAQPVISCLDLAKFLITCPILSEQRAISTTLSDVDALLKSLDRLIAKKRDLKQAAMQQLLTGQTRLPGFSGEWEVKEFSAVLVRVNAKAHQIDSSEYLNSGRFPVVDQGKESVASFSNMEKKCFRCPDGGVIVFGDHTCIVKFIDFDFIVGADGTQVLYGKEGQNTRFHALQLQFRGVATTGYNRHFKFLKERYFVTPPLDEQIAIATLLSDMEAELTELEVRHHKTIALKHGMMQELLTGRTRLV